MANIKFNHFSSQAFKSFVPEITKKANEKVFKNLLLIGGGAFGVWLIYELVRLSREKSKISEKGFSEIS
jgi:hypothetical protein